MSKVRDEINEKYLLDLMRKMPDELTEHIKAGQDVLLKLEATALLLRVSNDDLVAEIKALKNSYLAQAKKVQTIKMIAPVWDITHEEGKDDA